MVGVTYSIDLDEAFGDVDEKVCVAEQEMNELDSIFYFVSNAKNYGQVTIEQLEYLLERADVVLKRHLTDQRKRHMCAQVEKLSPSKNINKRRRLL